MYVRISNMQWLQLLFSIALGRAAALNFNKSQSHTEEGGMSAWYHEVYAQDMYMQISNTHWFQFLFSIARCAIQSQTECTTR